MRIVVSMHCVHAVCLQHVSLTRSHVQVNTVHRSIQSAKLQPSVSFGSAGRRNALTAHTEPERHRACLNIHVLGPQHHPNPPKILGALPQRRAPG